MFLVFGAALALAHPVEPLLHAVPGTPSVLLQCATLAHFEAFVGTDSILSDSLSGPLSGLLTPELGLDPGAPVTLVLGEDERQRHLGLRVEVQDATALETSAALTRAREQGVHWAIDEDAVLFFASQARSVDMPLPQKGIESMLPQLDPEAPGCVALVDSSVVPAPAPMPWFEGVVMAFSFDPLDPVEIVLRMEGFYAPEQLFSAMEGHRVRREPIGRGPQPPDVVLRLNLDLDELLALSPFLPPEVAAAAATFSASGVRLRPGSEVAVSDGVGEIPRFVAVLPVRRPLRLRKLQEGVEAEFVNRGVPAVWDEEILRLGEDSRAIYLAVQGRNVVIGTDVDGVRAVVRGEGEPWISPSFQEQAGEPGLFGQLRGRVRGDEPAPAWLNGDGLAVRVYSPASGALEVRIEGEGVKALATRRGGFNGGAQEQAPPPAPDDSEAAAILDLIAVAQNAARSAGGSFVPYAGGPRSVGELDGQRVLWEGIPALGIGPMETACRYEVSLGPDSFTARAICDEDDDGATAIRVVGPAASVERVTPEDVR